MDAETQARLKAFEQRLCGAEQLNQERFASRDLAVRIATRTMNHRLDTMNEFRSAIVDAQNRFMPRDEYSANHQALSDRLDALTARVDVNTTRLATIETMIGGLAARITGIEASKPQMWVGLITFFGMLFTAITVLVHLFGGK